MRRMGVLLLCALLLGGCGNGGTAARKATPKPVPTSLDLTLSLVHAASANDGSGIFRVDDTEGGPCSPEGPFGENTGRLAFMKTRAELVVKDAAGTISGKATLPDGVATNIMPNNPQARFYRSEQHS